MPRRPPEARAGTSGGERTLGRLLDDVAAGIRVLATRDGVALSERQVLDRARNIVAGLIGNYRITAFPDDEDDEGDDESPVPWRAPEGLATPRDGGSRSGERVGAALSPAVDTPDLVRLAG